MSIKYKIALLFASLLMFVLALLSLFIYFFSAGERTITFNTRLKNRALSTAKIYAAGDSKNFALLKRLDAASVASLYEKSITITGLNNIHEYLYADKPGDSMYLTNAIIERTKINDEYYFTSHGKKAIAIHHITDSSNFIVAVAANDLDGMDFLRQLKKLLIIALLVFTVISYAVGLIFARNIIRPIQRIIGEVNLITSNNLSQRIHINTTKDELTQLSHNFNTLLDRLQESFSIQRRFISNASHELSTPLTSISSQLEVTLQKSRTTEEYKEVMLSISEDIKEMQQLTRSLLDIAKTGSEGSIDLNEVRLDEVIFKVVSDVQRQNNAYKVNVSFDIFPDDEKLLTVFGNANLLYIALKNIIDNGCKYSNDNKSSISLLFNKAAIIIKVSSMGDIIAESDIQNIFQPFFRAGTAQNKPGFGLGLTLTKRILALHRGTIQVYSNPSSGTVFTIELPTIYAHSNKI
jgi:signal transduction histidine kinase